MSNNISGWRYYNHAAIPTTAPHEEPDLTPVKDESIWRIDGKKPLFVRYTTNWDCGYDTGWWYVIKDTPFDISTLKTKRRYEITKAMRFFDVKEIINPTEYAEAFAYVQEQAFSAYPLKYRPKFNKNTFINSLNGLYKKIKVGSIKVFAAFYKETSELAGYSYIIVNKKYVDFAVQKTNPAFEKFNVNAALVYGVLEAFKDKLLSGCYICDGARSINHETHFQDYLEKYFGFRKSYCNLNLTYLPLCKLMVALLFPFRNFVEKLGFRIGLFHQISAILKMEEIVRRIPKRGQI